MPVELRFERDRVDGDDLFAKDFVANSTSNGIAGILKLNNKLTPRPLLRRRRIPGSRSVQGSDLSTLALTIIAFTPHNPTTLSGRLQQVESSVIYMAVAIFVIPLVTATTGYLLGNGSDWDLVLGTLDPSFPPHTLSRPFFYLPSTHLHTTTSPHNANQNLPPQLKGNPKPVGTCIRHGLTHGPRILILFSISIMYTTLFRPVHQRIREHDAIMSTGTQTIGSESKELGSPTLEEAKAQNQIQTKANAQRAAITKLLVYPTAYTLYSKTPSLTKQLWIPGLKNRLAEALNKPQDFQNITTFFHTRRSSSGLRIV
ncbi:hypothetical protein HDU97_005738 [Phlyctochytrium planicorne]|nr:hypothetical protein HDU97_005738 [Phlyctochytrium planicorne]